MSKKIETGVWLHQIDDVMLEIARQASNCRVRLLDPGVIEAVLHDNDSVCGKSNPRAFKKLRETLMMGFFMREKAYEKLGPAEADLVISGVREKLREHFGDKLGGPD